MRSNVVLMIALAFGATGCGADPFTRGVAEYEAGSYAAALDAFAEAELLAGDHAEPSLLANRALSALRVGRAREAEVSAEKLVARGGDGYEGFRTHVFAVAAWLRAQRAQAEAGLTDPDPTAFARAIGHAEAALAGFEDLLDAEPARADAQRNFVRVARMLDALQKAREEAEKNRRNKREGAEDRPAPEPEADTDAPPEEVEQAPELQQDDGALTADEVEALLARLARKEAEKRQLRRDQRAARTPSTERDW
jgi:tetratricopeptide (TPR) repeat protein